MLRLHGIKNERSALCTLVLSVLAAWRCNGAQSVTRTRCCADLSAEALVALGKDGAKAASSAATLSGDAVILCCRTTKPCSAFF
jgi:hypothetical protein